MAFPNAAPDAPGPTAATDATVAQYNADLATPVGVHRGLTLSVLKEFAGLVQAHRMSEARQLLGSVHPEADGEHPAVSQVIGLAASLLDDWAADPAYKAAVRGAKLPKWSKPASKAARDVLGACLKHRAFSTTTDLVRRHQAENAFEGSAVAVAAVLAAIARKSRGGVDRVAAELLPDAAAPIRRREAWQPSPDAGESGSEEETLPLSLKGEERVQAQEAELRVAERAATLSEEDLEREVQWFRLVVSAAEGVGVDLDDPEQTLSFFDSLRSFAQMPEDVLPGFLFALSDYVEARYRADPGTWEHVDTKIGEVLQELFGDSKRPGARVGDADTGDDTEQAAANVPAEVVDLIQGVDEISLEERVAAVTATPVVAGIRELTDWIGSGRQVTASGQLRRADIEPVAAMLGLRAQGVAKRPAAGEEGDIADAEHPLQVRSANEIAELALWWDVLARGNLVEVGKTKVQVGPEAQKYGAEAAFEDLEQFLAAFVVWYLRSVLVPEDTDAEESETHTLIREQAARLVGLTLAAALQAAEPTSVGAGVRVEAAGVEQALSPDVRDAAVAQARTNLAGLARLQLLGLTDEGRLSVPRGLRHAVLNSVAGMKAYAPEAFAWFDLGE